MSRIETLEFEIYVMSLAEKCKTAEDYEKLAQQLHESVETAIQDMCMDYGVKDYEPSYY